MSSDSSNDPHENPFLGIDQREPYDDQNVFAKIVRGEIPSNKVYEDEHVLAFHDINPAAPVHVQVIPKGEYVSLDDFVDKASDAEIAHFFRTVKKIAHDLELAGPGYRLLMNTGRDSNQQVPHLHLHIFGGRNMGPLLPKG